MTVGPGTAINVSVRFRRLFLTCVRHCMLFFTGIEFKHVELPVDSDLSISTVSVRP